MKLRLCASVRRRIFLGEALGHHSCWWMVLSLCLGAESDWIAFTHHI